jgi:hypothetical protein
MPYERTNFDELVKDVPDEKFRLAAIQVHDNLYLAIASITTLFGKEAVTPERALEVEARMSARYAQLSSAE